MAGSRGCDGINEGGQPCGATVRRDSRYCFFHDPETQQEVAEARRLGGLRRRREGTVLGVYDFEGLRSTEQIRRILEIAVIDTLSLDNSVARNRTLGTLVQTGLRILEVGELEQRVAQVEAVLAPQRGAR